MIDLRIEQSRQFVDLMIYNDLRSGYFSNFNQEEFNHFNSNVHDFIEKKYQEAFIKIDNKNCMVVDTIQDKKT